MEALVCNELLLACVSAEGRGREGKGRGTGGRGEGGLVNGEFSKERDNEEKSF